MVRVSSARRIALRAVLRSPRAGQPLNAWVDSGRGTINVRTESQARCASRFWLWYGPMIRYFGTQGWSVIGTDVTEGMLERAREFGLPPGCQLYLTDGVSIPLANQSVDMIWVCGVLKYTLFDPSSRCRGGTEPDKIASKASDRQSDTTSVETFSAVYSDVAKEMYRVLKPGGFVINVEMWVEAEPDVFISDFEDSGFVNKRVGVLRRYLGMPERIGEWREWHPLPERIVVTAGLLIAQIRLWFDSPRLKCEGMRDYLFVWSKPNG